MHPEEELRERLRDEVAFGAAPPLGPLAAGALAGGKQRHRRRQFVQVLSGTAALAVVAVGSTSLSSAFGGHGGAVNAAGGGASNLALAGSATSTPPAAAAGSVGAAANGAYSTLPPLDVPPPAAPLKPADPAAVTGQSMTAQLLKLLPSGATTSNYAGHGSPTDGSQAKLTYNDGHGAVGLTLNVGTPRPAVHDLECGFAGAAPVGSAGSAKPVPPKGTACEVQTLSDGTQVQVSHLPNPDGKTFVDGVEILRTDGVLVEAFEFNGDSGVAETPKPTRPDAALSFTQLYQIVADPHWGSTMEKSFVDHAGKTIKLVSQGSF
ncbi:hypothetical protein KGQ19_30850 [Catenulispora sp. NL8]|uniref:Tat pathway signal sequence domain protein n=1 Tax=Catenulispora pinistramenti TaxID=2705254 RepID=A0ABS5KYX2_9ACTN|nr:hypothetical protein [Catenulispora pinistramenti]MBS2551276.1 hypothetical protein [Catenulispora pinistramenti]